jgi:hypothetical protein
MSDVLSNPFAYGLPTARRVEEDGRGHRDHVANIWGLTPADEWRLRQARQHFIEVDVGDFDQVGKDFVDRATGKSYRIALSDPTVSDNPKDTGIELFRDMGSEAAVLEAAGV